MGDDPMIIGLAAAVVTLALALVVLAILLIPAHTGAAPV
jgi:hypothetical protein